MTVIQFPQRPPSGRDSDIPISGTFPSPSGRSGTMTGWLRVERLRLDREHSSVEGVFTGELVDADGQRIGSCSRRHSAPARTGESDDDPITVGPVDVDLMGLVVSVPAVSVSQARDGMRRGHVSTARRHTDTDVERLADDYARTPERG